MMRGALNRAAWTLIASGSAVVAGEVARRSLRFGWRSMRGEDPPLQPASLRTSWGDALLWAALTGVVVGLVRLIVRRGAAAGWRKVRGELPPGV